MAGYCRHGPTIWHTEGMQDESPLTLRQADLLRTDITNLESGLEVIMRQMAQSADLQGVGKVVLLVSFVVTGLGIVRIKALWYYFAYGSI